MKYITLYIFTLFFSILISVTSCQKFVELDSPNTKAESSRIFSDDATAISGTVGLYYQLVSGNLTFFNGGITIYSGLSADEIVNLNSTLNYDSFKNNSILTNNSIIASTFWSNPYRNIYQCNAVIEGLENSTTLSVSVKQELKAEMLFMRAFHYFYLVNLYGNVPLETSTDYEVNGKTPRLSTNLVYDQIVNDLLKARTLFNTSSPTPFTRPSKESATGLLARVYLYQKRWAEAESMATEVINSGKFKLEALNNVFLKTSSETIFSLSKITTNTSEGSTFIPLSVTTRPTFVITQGLLNSFENSDLRRTAWLKANSIGGQLYYYPFKYKVKNSATVTEFYVVQRLAELYLIRSEARVQQDNIDQAVEDIDVIRIRAGLNGVRTGNPTINKTDLLAAIYKERRLELFAEWGHRWFDLKRTGLIDGVLGTLKAPNWSSTDKNYPIPASEIKLNSGLTQNDGYTN